MKILNIENTGQQSSQSRGRMTLGASRPIDKLHIFMISVANCFLPQYCRDAHPPWLLETASPFPVLL